MHAAQGHIIASKCHSSKEPGRPANLQENSRQERDWLWVVGTGFSKGWWG